MTSFYSLLLFYSCALLFAWVEAANERSSQLFLLRRVNGAKRKYFSLPPSHSPFQMIGNYFTFSVELLLEIVILLLIFCTRPATPTRSNDSKLNRWRTTKYTIKRLARMKKKKRSTKLICDL